MKFPGVLLQIQKMLIPTLFGCALSGCIGGSMMQSSVSKFFSSSGGGSGGSGLLPPQLPGLESQILLANKNHVSSTLTTVFGPGAQSVANSHVLNNLMIFGGPCDLTRNDCQDTHHSQLPLNPSAIANRFGFLTRACDVIVSTDANVLFAIRTALASPALAQASVVAPTSAHLGKAYELFFLDRPMDSDVLAVYSQIVSDAQAQSLNGFEQWRFLLLTMCLSPDWQVL